MNYIKLIRCNAWASYFLNITPTNDESRGRLKCVPGELVSVRFPDGSTAELPVQMKTVRGGYSEHGRYTETVSEIPGVVIDARGIAVLIELDRVEVPEAWAREHGAK